MNTLSRDQEQLIEEFAYDLSMIDGPEDIFPPDDLGGVREPRVPIMPQGSNAETISLAAVYDLALTRERRARLYKTGSGLLRNIDLVLV